MREIGGYIELDSYCLPMLHEGAVALNCGRNALAYLLRARQIKKTADTEADLRFRDESM